MPSDLEKSIRGKYMISRVGLCIAVGSLFSGLVFALASYLFTMNDHSGGLLPLSDWWYIVVLVALAFGAIIGGISGAIIAGFQFGLIKAAVFGFVFNSLISIALYIFAGADMSHGVRYSLLSLIPIGLFNGAIVSLASVGTKIDS